jgi:hypothetical protein
LDAQTALLQHGDIDFKYRPMSWYSGYTQDYKYTRTALQRYHLHLSAMLGVLTNMRLDFQRERSLLSQAQSLLAQANALVARHIGTQQNASQKPSNMVLAILRSGNKKAVFSQMISRNHAIMNRLNGRAAGYQDVLRPATIKGYRLDKAPFEGNRRYPNQYAKLIKSMEAAIYDARQAEAKDKSNSPVLQQCDKLLKQLDEIGSKARLLSRPVGEVIDQAEKKIRLVQGVVAPERRPIIRDVDAAGETSIFSKTSPPRPRPTTLPTIARYDAI